MTSPASIHFIYKALACACILITWLSCSRDYNRDPPEICEPICDKITECMTDSVYGELSAGDCLFECSISEEKQECYDCMDLKNCDEWIKCIFNNCRLRPPPSLCETTCEMASECSREYIDVKRCTDDCMTTLRLYDCLECRLIDDCYELLNCLTSNCFN